MSNKSCEMVFYFLKKVSETWALTILSFYGRIIATAIRMVLSLIYENHEGLILLPFNRSFLKAIYGFRWSKSCHRAFNTISNWELAKWFISVDI